MEDTIKRRKKKPIKDRLRIIIRRRLISGLLVVIPLGLTAFILRFLYNLTAGRLTPLTRKIFDPLPEYVVPVVSLLVMGVVLYGVGLIASVVVGRKLIGLVEAVLDRIPLVKTVYGASKQVVQTLSFNDGSANFDSVVMIDFPHPGMKALAFVTGRVTLIDADSGAELEHYRVFVPTTPNPTSGYLEFVPINAVENPAISVEEAVKMIMSGGLITPETFGAAIPVNGAFPESESPL
jgi:uncharacterized membrane protein